ncbi:MAG TPA: glycosyl hydrolase [Chloroflexi bacterium]|nr:glycosyl hydrolase [Chloroflexota bacterium]
MKFEIHCDGELAAFRHFWRSTGFTPANLLLNQDMQQAMAHVGSIPHNGITWVRVHYLLELVRARHLDTASPHYDWSRLDQAIDVLIDNGLKPFFELMGNVEGFFNDYTDPAQAEAWRRLIRDLALHMIARYGREEVRSWLFETWNEPDIGFWLQGDEAFLVYYDACCAGLQDADPKLRLGGPGTCRNLSSTLRAFLTHCERGTNTLTGKPASRPAFISVHEKGVRAHVEDLTPDSMGIVSRELRIIEYIRRNHPGLRSIPFTNNECDPQVGWSTIHTWRARPYYAAMVAKIINQHLRVLINDHGVDYGLLGNDNGFLGTWGHRTLLTRFAETGHIDHGQAPGHRDPPRFDEDPRHRRFELVKKPVFNAMTLLALMGDQSCRVVGEAGTDSTVGVLATRRDEGQIAILIYNCDDRVMHSDTCPITLSIHGLPFNQARLVTYLIEEDTGDPFHVWEAMGAPDLPDGAQLAELRRHQEPAYAGPPRDIQCPDGSLTLTFDLPQPAVRLILLSTRPTKGPSAVTGLRATVYESFTGQESLLLRWLPLDSYFIKTYEVLASTGPQGRFTRVNASDQITSAYVHSRPHGPLYYRVRAVDFWGRTGPPSEVLKA